MRTRQEIDFEYTQIATTYGDRLFKQTILQEEIKKLFQRMAELNQEPALSSLPSQPLEASNPESEKVSDKDI